MYTVTEAGRRPGGAEELSRLLVGGPGYAFFLLDAGGHVSAWGAGAERLLGYRPDEVRGAHFGRLFFRPEEVRRGEPEHELRTALAVGQASQSRWYAHKGGTALWCAGVTVALRDRAGNLRAFAKVVQDLTARKLREWEPGPGNWVGEG